MTERDPMIDRIEKQERLVETSKEYKAPFASNSDILYCWKCKLNGHKPGDKSCIYQQLASVRSEQLRRGAEDPIGAFLNLIQRPKNTASGGAAAAAAGAGPSSSAAAPGAEPGQAEAEVPDLAAQLERELATEYEKWKRKRAEKEAKQKRRREKKKLKKEKGGGKSGKSKKGKRGSDDK